MGNAAPQRMCREEAAATSVGRRRGLKNAATGTGAVTTPPRKLQRARGDATRRASKVSWAGGVLDDDHAAAGGKAPAAAVATVKIVLRRKDAEALVARLNAQSARERKARMDEIKGELRAVDCGGGASPAPCRDAWKPRLAPIKEN